jgi:hypothetical protein
VIAENAKRSVPGISGLPAIGLAAALGMIRTNGAAAFPLIDPSNQDQVPQGTELAAPDAQDLRHQLQIVNGLAAPAGGGWTFVPRIDLQEMLTDNVEQAHSPRRADLATYFAPGFSLAGNQPRVQMTLSYAPTLSLYARTGSLDALTEQLNGLATVTLAPDLAYVDLRALAGVQSLYGGFGGLGAVGAPAGTAATAQAGIPVLAGNAAGLNRNNEVQTASFGISPYLLHSFGDWGSGKLGYSLGLTRSDSLAGFFAPPYPTGGPNGQTLLSNEVIGHYATGEILSFVQDSVDVDILHGQTSYDGTGPAQPNGTSSSSIFLTDKVSYALTRDVVVFASGGHEDITYSNQVVSTLGPNGQIQQSSFSNAPGPRIHDFTWSLGGTWTPNPDSSLTVSYGHQNGFNAFTVNGHYQATPRTLLSVSYGSTLGTQLQYLQNQLNLAAPNGTGAEVNGLTGGSLFGATNALAVRDGVFRTDTLTVGSSTSLDLDIISVNLLLTRQTATSGAGVSATSNGGSAAWLHQMRPDMTLSAALSLAVQDQTATAGRSGDTTSVAASLAWQYHLSETLTASVRYSFLEQQGPAAIYNIYENMLILGISKTF